MTYSTLILSTYFHQLIELSPSKSNNFFSDFDFYSSGTMTFDEDALNSNNTTVVTDKEVRHN